MIRLIHITFNIFIICEVIQCSYLNNIINYSLTLDMMRLNRKDVYWFEDQFFAIKGQPFNITLLNYNAIDAKCCKSDDVDILLKISESVKDICNYYEQFPTEFATVYEVGMSKTVIKVPNMTTGITSAWICDVKTTDNTRQRIRFKLHIKDIESAGAANKYATIFGPVAAVIILLIVAIVTKTYLKDRKARAQDSRRTDDVQLRPLPAVPDANSHLTDAYQCAFPEPNYEEIQYINPHFQSKDFQNTLYHWI